MVVETDPGGAGVGTSETQGSNGEVFQNSGNANSRRSTTFADDERVPALPISQVSDRGSNTATARYLHIPRPGGGVRKRSTSVKAEDDYHTGSGPFPSSTTPGWRKYRRNVKSEWVHGSSYRNAQPTATSHHCNAAVEEDTSSARSTGTKSTSVRNGEREFSFSGESATHRFADESTAHPEPTTFPGAAAFSRMASSVPPWLLTATNSTATLIYRIYTRLPFVHSAVAIGSVTASTAWSITKAIFLWFIPLVCMFALSWIISLLGCMVLFGGIYWLTVPDRTMVFPVYFNYRPSFHFPVQRRTPIGSFQNLNPFLAPRAVGRRVHQSNGEAGTGTQARTPIQGSAMQLSANNEIASENKFYQSNDFGDNIHLGDDLIDAAGQIESYGASDPMADTAHADSAHLSEGNPNSGDDSHHPADAANPRDPHFLVDQYPIDLAIATVALSNRSWHYIDEHYLLDTQLSEVRFGPPVGKPLPLNEELDVSLSFAPMGPSFVPNSHPGPYFDDQRLHQRNLHRSSHNDYGRDPSFHYAPHGAPPRSRGGMGTASQLHYNPEFVNPQPLQHEPVMMSVDMYDTNGVPVATSARPYFPMAPGFLRFQDFLNSLPLLFYLPVHLVVSPMLWLSSLLFGQLFPWMITGRESKMALMERFPNSDRRALGTAVLRMQPMLPLQSPCFLVFDVHLHGARKYLRDHPYVSLLLFWFLVAWIPALLIFSVFSAVYWQLLTLIFYSDGKEHRRGDGDDDNWRRHHRQKVYPSTSSTSPSVEYQHLGGLYHHAAGNRQNRSASSSESSTDGLDYDTQE